MGALTTLSTGVFGVLGFRGCLSWPHTAVCMTYLCTLGPRGIKIQNHARMRVVDTTRLLRRLAGVLEYCNRGRRTIVLCEFTPRQCPPSGSAGARRTFTPVSTKLLSSHEACNSISINATATAAGGGRRPPVSGLSVGRCKSKPVQPVLKMPGLPLVFLFLRMTAKMRCVYTVRPKLWPLASS